MDSAKGSCSSPNVDDDRPMSWFADTAGTGSTSYAFVEAKQVLPNNVTPKSGLGSSTALRSSWIQRLKPVGRDMDSEEEPMGWRKDSHVRTHFTKDFSSCRRSNASTHTRSSSWPPNGILANAEVLCRNKLATPASGPCAGGKLWNHMAMESHKPWNHTARENSRNLREHNLRVPRASATTGSFGFGEEKRIDGTSIFPLEALVPCAPTPILTQSIPSGTGNADYFGQGALDIKISAFKSATGVPRKRVLFLQPESISPTVASRMDAYQCEASSDWDAKGRLISSLASVSKLVESEGASADADRRLFALPVHIEDKLMERPRGPDRVESGSPDVGIQEPIKSLQSSPGKPGEETAFPLEVTRTITRKDKYGYLGICDSKGSENDINMKSEDMSLRRHVRDSDFQKRSVGDCFVSSSDRCYDTVSQRLCKSITWNTFHGCAIDRKKGKKAEEVCGLDSEVLAAPPTVEKSDPAGTRIRISRMETELLPAGKMLILEGGNRNEVHFERKPSASDQGDDFTRFPVSEIGARDYWSSWIQLFEDSEHKQPKDRVSPTASLPQDYFLEEYHRFRLKQSTDFRKSDISEKLENQASGPYKITKASVGIQSSCDLLDNDGTKLQQGKSEIHAKRTHWSRVADRKNQEGVKASSNLQGLNHHYSKEATGRVAPQVENNHASAEGFTFDKTREISSTQQAWIQRWCSSVRSGAGSEEALRYSPDTNVELPLNLPVKCSPRARYTRSSTSKGKSEVGCSDQTFRGTNTEGNRNMEAAEAHVEECMLGRSHPTGRRSILLQGKYMVPSVEAMAIVGTSTRQMHTSPLQNRGSFSVWPSIEAASENFKSIGFPEDVTFESEENVQLGGVSMAKR